jgi:hypothetical protein
LAKGVVASDTVDRTDDLDPSDESTVDEAASSLPLSESFLGSASPRSPTALLGPPSFDKLSPIAQASSSPQPVDVTCASSGSPRPSRTPATETPESLRGHACKSRDEETSCAWCNILEERGIFLSAALALLEERESSHVIEHVGSPASPQKLSRAPVIKKGTLSKRGRGQGVATFNAAWKRKNVELRYGLFT